MKVYIITSGEYSDYKIDAVTLDKEEAERMVKFMNNNFNEKYQNYLKENNI